MHGMTRREVRTQLGARIRSLREGRGMGLRTLSALSDIPEFMIGAIERGGMHFTIEHLLCLARALAVPVTTFLAPDDTDGEAGPGAWPVRRTRKRRVKPAGAGPFDVPLGAYAHISQRRH